MSNQRRPVTGQDAEHDRTSLMDSDELNAEHVAASVDKTPYSAVSEGKAEVLFPSTQDVFYNPVQEFNRDISIAVMKLCVPKWSEENVRQMKPSSQDTTFNKQSCIILEALAASGLRSIRYALEVPGVEKIIANDVSPKAADSINRNVKHNKVETIVTASREDASLLMYNHRQHQKRFHAIDLDPYGSPAPFLDAAVQSVKDGGLLMVTCTDMAVLCGNSSETCHAKYGAVSLKIKSCHEMALRIILQSIESHANRYGRYIVPLLSLSVDFYVRIFVQLFTSPSIVKRSASKLAMVFHCTGCETFHFQPLGKSVSTDKGYKYMPAQGPPVAMTCDYCNHRFQLGGPIWANHLHSKDFVRNLLSAVKEDQELYKTGERMVGILSVVEEELDDCPLYYVIDKLASTVHAVTPSMVQFRSALLNAGYRVSLSHACRSSVKTDAPITVIWDIMREWVKLHPLKRDLEERSVAKAILSKPASIKISFDIHHEANPVSRRECLVRFQVNPEPHWGPKMRAKTSLWNTKQIEKQQRLQGKRTHKPDETEALDNSVWVKNSRKDDDTPASV